MIRLWRKIIYITIACLVLVTVYVLIGLNKKYHSKYNEERTAFIFHHEKIVDIEKRNGGNTDDPEAEIDRNDIQQPKLSEPTTKHGLLIDVVVSVTVNLIIDFISLDMQIKFTCVMPACSI